MGAPARGATFAAIEEAPVRSRILAVGVVLALSLVACGSEENDAPDEESRFPATLLGDPTQPRFTTIADASHGLKGPRDLAFHPERDGEAWVVNRTDESVLIIRGATGPSPSYERRKDGYAVHFMSHVSSIAFGAKNFRDDYSFGTCQESTNTYGGVAEPDYFMGSALWSANLDVFAIENPIGLGSHIDMLHHSPLCMGIAHEVDNVYWVFDGYNGQIVRYDFQHDHDAGYDDHSDGIIHFLDEPKVRRIENIPSHLVIEKETRKLYVADTGRSRVLQIDIDQREFFRNLPIKESGTIVQEYTGIDWVEVVPQRTVLTAPSGIAVHDGILYVSDNATGKIHAFDVRSDFGEELAVVDTGLEAGSLMGIEVGPDQRLYLVDFGGRVLRLER